MQIQIYRFVASLSVSFAMILTASSCTNSKEDSSESGVIEVATWWTQGQERANFNSLFDVFNAAHPEYELTSSTENGSSAITARAELAVRLREGNPPDSFQARAGAELVDLVQDENLRDLTSLFVEQKWSEVMPAEMLRHISIEEKLYSVPINAQRANIIWGNKKLLDENGLSTPKTWEEFFVIGDKLKLKGITSLMLHSQGSFLQLFETVLLGSMGADLYNGLWDGTTKWDSAELRKALEIFGKVLNYTNLDYLETSQESAIDSMIEGSGVFVITGDWAERYLSVTNSLTEGQDYVWAPTPGSQGVFQFFSDSFVLPIDSDNPSVAMSWLKVVGSKEAQEVFNSNLSSIPVRTDVSNSSFSSFQVSLMRDWKSNRIVGSVTFGTAVSNSWKAGIDTAVSEFVLDRKMKEFQSILAKAALDASDK